MGRVFRGVGLWLGLSCVLFSLPTTAARAQVRPVESEASQPETSVADALYHLSLQAAFVFVGTVESIERRPGFVEVGLRVDRVLQGEPGGHYVLREWAGRWPPGLNRYTVGQCALFFLPAPGPSGLSSPVGGSEGVVPVHGDVNNPDAAAVVDTRWLGTRVQRQIGDPLPGAQPLTVARAAQAIAQGRAGGTRRPANPFGEEPVPILRQTPPGARVSGGVHGTQ